MHNLEKMIRTKEIYLLENEKKRGERRENDDQETREWKEEESIQRTIEIEWRNNLNKDASMTQRVNEKTKWKNADNPSWELRQSRMKRSVCKMCFSN